LEPPPGSHWRTRVERLDDEGRAHGLRGAADGRLLDEADVLAADREQVVAQEQRVELRGDPCRLEADGVALDVGILDVLVDLAAVRDELGRVSLADSSLDRHVALAAQGHAVRCSGDRRAGARIGQGQTDDFRATEVDTLLCHDELLC
jgi:hypothetical protein